MPKHSMYIRERVRPRPTKGPPKGHLVAPVTSYTAATVVYVEYRCINPHTCNTCNYRAIHYA